jgi:co-chaperonin GroES (HSP10)
MYQKGDLIPLTKKIYAYSGGVDGFKFVPGYCDATGGSQGIEEDRIWLQIAEGNGYMTYVSDKPIDFTEVNKIVIYWYCTAPTEDFANYAQVKLSDDKDTSGGNIVLQQERTSGGYKATVIDVSNITGEKYIKLQAYVAIGDKTIFFTIRGIMLTK